MRRRQEIMRGVVIVYDESGEPIEVESEHSRYLTGWVEALVENVLGANVAFGDWKPCRNGARRAAIEVDS